VEPLRTVFGWQNNCLDGRADHVGHPAPIPLRVDEREPVEPTRLGRHDAGHLHIRRRVVGAEGSEQQTVASMPAAAALRR
jgi:hypothetical protein